MADQVILPLLNPRGVYSASVVYNPNDLVTYNGVPYYCRIGTIAGQPITPGSDPNTWQLLNTPGADGEKGDRGIQGEQGPRGRQGIAGPSGAGYKPRGEWNATTTYQAADSVTRYVPTQGTGVWFAIKDNTNVTPGTDATVWASGIKGDTGDVTPEAIAARDDAADSAAAALASQNAAKTSETNSKTSETNANASKIAAASSATAADDSKTAAAASATAADTSKQAAAASATAADTSKQAAAGSATAASNSAAAALASQNAAKTSETNSKTSETNAAASAAAAQAAAGSVSNPVSKLGDTMTGDLWVGDPASTAGKTLGTNYRVGIARNTVGGVPYQVITNGQNVLATPPAAQASIGQILYRWASTTSDVLAGQSAVELNGYANTDGSGSFAIRTRNAANAVLGNLWLAANRLIFGTSIDDGATPVQINPAGVTSPVLNAPTMRVIDSGNGTAGGLSVEAFQPLIQFIDRSASAKNSRIMQNAGQLLFSNDPGDNSGTFGATGFAISPDGYAAVGVSATLSVNVGMYVNGTSPGTATSQYGVYMTQEFNAAATSNGYAFASQPKVKDAAFTMTGLYGFIANPPTVGASATVTNYHAFYAADASIATNVFGFRSNLAAGANKWNFYASGTASNYLAGRTLFGTTTDDTSTQVQIENPASGHALKVRRNGQATQYIGIGSNTGLDAAAPNDHKIVGYSPTTAAKPIYLHATTDEAGSAPTSGTVGIVFKVLANACAKIFQSGNLVINPTGALTDDGVNALQVTGSATISAGLTAKQAVTLDGSGKSADFFVAINNDKAQHAGLNFSKTGLKRWMMFCDNSAESGSNAGANFVLNRYDDSGTFISQPISVERSTGKISTSTSGAIAISAASTANIASLMLGANTYKPQMRANTTNTSMEWVNGANTLVTMTLSDAGSLALNTTANNNKLVITGHGPGRGAGLVLNPTLDGSTQILFTSSGGQVAGSVSTSGTTTSFNTTSDYRLKKNYAPIAGSREVLRQIKFYTGEMVDTVGVLDYVLAHELQPVIPAAVTGKKDAVGEWRPVYRDGFDPNALVEVTEQFALTTVDEAGNTVALLDEDGKPTYGERTLSVRVQPTIDDVIDAVQDIEPQTVDYSKLVPRLGGAVQEIDSDVVALTARVVELEDQNAKLFDALKALTDRIVALESK